MSDNWPWNETMVERSVDQQTSGEVSSFRFDSSSRAYLSIE